LCMWWLTSRFLPTPNECSSRPAIHKGREGV
jgi:hypothetical protein